MTPTPPPRRNGRKRTTPAGRPKRVFFPRIEESQFRPRQEQLFDNAKEPLGQRVTIAKVRPTNGNVGRKMVALLNKSPIAELRYEKRTQKVKGKLVPSLHIASIWVKSENDYGKGVGRRLLESFLTRIKQIPKKKLGYAFITMDVDSENTRMIEIAKRAGFTQVGTSEHGARGTDDVMLHFRMSI